MLTLKKVNKALNDKWPGVQLFHGEGYFFVYSDNKELGLKIAGLYQSSIHVFAINHLSLEQWIESVDFVLQDKYRLECDREPVFSELRWYTIQDQQGFFQAHFPFHYSEGNKVFGWLHDENKNCINVTTIPETLLTQVK